MDPQYDSYRSAPIPRDVADVVTHVIGNRGRVTGIVFGNPLLDLTDQIRTDIRRFGEDTTAHACEECLATGSHSKAEHRDRDIGQRQRIANVGPQPVEERKPDRNVQEPQTDDRQAHDRTTTKSHLEALVQ